MTLLYRTRQVALLSPAVGPLPIPTLGDTLDLLRIYLNRAPPSPPSAGLSASSPPAPLVTPPLVSPANH